MPFDVYINLKGVVLNLSLTPLAEKASNLTEILRGENKKTASKEEVDNLVNDIEILYLGIISNIE